VNVLPGDFDDNGVVNGKDLTAIRNEWKSKRGAMPTIFGEIVVDGTVGASDDNIVKKLLGTRLPRLAAEMGPRADVRPASVVRLHFGN
jgi:hypothetical protein